MWTDHNHCIIKMQSQGRLCVHNYYANTHPNNSKISIPVRLHCLQQVLITYTRIQSLLKALGCLRAAAIQIITHAEATHHGFGRPT